MTDKDLLDDDSSTRFLRVGASVGRKTGRPRNVLVIEDDIADFKIIKRCLDKAAGVHFNVEGVMRLTDGLARLAEGGIDVVLLDLGLSESRGIATFLEAQSCAPHVPIIVLTGLDDESVAMQAVQQGAQDYLVKGQLETNLLVRSIRYSMARHRTQARLSQAFQLARANEANLRNVIAGNLDGIVVVDDQGVMQFSNRAAQDLFGRSKHELQGQGFGFPLSAGEPTEVEVLRNDGAHVPVELRVVEVEWEGERAHLAILRDLRGQRQAEEDRALLAAVVDSTEDAIITADLDGIILSWNVGAARVFGYAATEAVRRHVSMLAVPEQSDAVYEILATVRRGESIIQQDAVGVRKDGCRIDLSVTVSPIRNVHGEIVRTSGIVRDITERKRLQKARLEAQARAEAAEEISRAKQEFLSVMSHELKTPLSSIMGFSEFLAAGHGGPLADQQQDFIDRIARNARNLLERIEQMLHLSQIEADWLQLKVADVNLEKAFADCLTLFSQTAAQRRIDLETQLEPGLSTIAVDPNWFGHLLENLVSNAVKFTPVGGTISLRARSASADDPAISSATGASDAAAEDDGWVVISVADTGVGIAQTDRKRIFDPFEQVDTPANRKQQGAGIGLTLCQKIVARHGGHLWVDSQPGEGSTFSFTLPVRKR